MLSAKLNATVTGSGALNRIPRGITAVPLSSPCSQSTRTSHGAPVGRWRRSRPSPSMSNEIGSSSGSTKLESARSVTSALLMPSNTPSGSSLNLLAASDNCCNEVISLNSPGGRVLNWFKLSPSTVTALSPPKSPGRSAVIGATPGLGNKNISPLIAPRCAAVTAAQLLTGARDTMKSRTRGVRMHTSLPCTATLNTNCARSPSPSVARQVSWREAAMALGVPLRTRALWLKVSPAGSAPNSAWLKLPSPPVASGRVSGALARVAI